MMVHSRDTCLADTAVLAPSWLQELASRANVARVVQHPIVRIVPHLLGMIQRVDVRLMVSLRTQIQKDVRLRQQGAYDEYVVPFEDMPDGGQEQRGACGYEAEEEEDNGEMLLVHEMVAQPGATTRDAAIGELDIELAECGGDVDDEETVEGAYGCVPAHVRCRLLQGALCIPEGRQTSEEGYKRQQRHRHGEDDDVARECHGERAWIVRILTRRRVDKE